MHESKSPKLMSPLNLPNKKIPVSRTGLHITGQLSPEEWQQLAKSIGEVATATAFVIGDWLVYGQSLFGINGFPDHKVDEASFVLAADATGLDRPTLQTYAYVSRSIPHAMRSERLSWDHHRILAKLPADDIPAWIEMCHAEEDAGRRMSVRRLRKSISLGRIATAADMEPDPADKGIDNHIPFVNRLSTWWRRREAESFLARATSEQRHALKRDLQPVVDIYNKL